MSLPTSGVIVAMDGPTLEQFQSLLAHLVASATPFEGVVYRSSTPQYATETDLLTGAGGLHYANRWNPKGMAMVYAALTPETAMAETLASNRYYGVAIQDAMPRVFVAIEVKVSAVLDLRNAEVFRHLQVSEEQCTALDWRIEVKAGREPFTHHLARAAHSGPWEGLIVPSAPATGQHNLLIFPDKLGPASSLKVANAEKLGKK